MENVQKFGHEMMYWQESFGTNILMNNKNRIAPHARKEENLLKHWEMYLGEEIKISVIGGFGAYGDGTTSFEVGIFDTKHSNSIYNPWNYINGNVTETGKALDTCQRIYGWIKEEEVKNIIDLMIQAYQERNKEK